MSILVLPNRKISLCVNVAWGSLALPSHNQIRSAIGATEHCVFDMSSQ